MIKILDNNLKFVYHKIFLGLMLALPPTNERKHSISSGPSYCVVVRSLCVCCIFVCPVEDESSRLMYLYALGVHAPTYSNTNTSTLFFMTL